MRRSLALLFSLAAVACGPAQEPVRHADAHANAPPDRHDLETPPQRPSRTLGATATFDDLVRTARALDAAGAEGSTRGCLLDADGLAADVAVPVRPLPSLWDDASALLATRPGAVRVLSRWGTTPGDSALAVAAFTTFAPPRDDASMVVLYLTARGVWARSTSAADPATSPVPVDAVPDGVPLLARGPAAVVVTADSGTPVADVRALLARLAAVDAPVALAVPFPIDTHLPATAADAGAPLCPNGLPAPPEGTPDGDLAPSDAVAALAPARDAIRACMTAVPRDGAVDVVLRVAASGAVEDACVQRDEVGSAAARACVLGAVRALHFPAPRPAGVVDLALPFRLVADRGAVAQRALCE